MKRMKAIRNGFTLVELMITIVVFGVAIAAIYQVFTSSVSSVSKGTADATMQQNIRVAMDEVVRDVRQAGYGIGSHPAFTTAGKREIQFWANVDGVAPTNLIRYFVGPTSDLTDTVNPNDAILYREDTEVSAQPLPIAAGAREVEFQYYDENGTALLNGTDDDAVVESDVDVADLNGNGEPDVDDIRSVEVRLVFETDQPDHRMSFNDGYMQYALTTTLYPLNLKLLLQDLPPDELISLEIEPDPAPTTRPGEDVQFSALGTYAESGTRDVTDLAEWSSSDTAVATIHTNAAGTHEGTAGLATAVGTGITQITCTYDGIASSNSVSFKVGGPDATKVRINGAPRYAMVENSASTVTVTAEINDLAFGASTISAAQYLVPSKAIVGSMSASDGSFDSPVENVVKVVDITGWAEGTYAFYVQGETSADPGSWGPMESAVLVIMATDELGPMVKNITASPSATIPAGTPTITLTANIDDRATGGSNIAAAEISINGYNMPGTGTPMSAVDGALDSANEAMTYTIDTSSWSDVQSPFRLFVVGQDAAGNWGSPEFFDVIVTPSDNQAPLVTALTAPTTISSGISAVSVSGSATDVGRGGANIAAVEVFPDDDPGAGSATPAAASDGAFDSPAENFDVDLGTFPWQPGSQHTIYARAKDEHDNWGPTKSVIVNVTTSSNGSDAVVASSSGNFEVWFGDGNGGFKGKDSYVSPSGTEDLLVADLNGDEFGDVVLAKNDKKLHIWLNNGFGALGAVPAQKIDMGAPLTGVVAADFNNDLRIDLVAVTSDGQVRYFQNDGSGVFNTSNYLVYDPTQLQDIRGIAAADFSGDSYMDLVIAGVEDNMVWKELQVLVNPGLGGGSWTVIGPYNYNGELAGLNAEDYNTDGTADVVLALNGATPGLQVWKGDGTGKVAPTALQLWNDYIYAIQSSDYDNDGDVDILLGTLGSSGQEVYVSPNNGGGYFDTVSPYYAGVGSPVTAVAFDYLDQDNVLDIVAGDQSSMLYTFIQQPTKNFLQTTNSPFSSSAPAMVVRTGEIGN